MKMPRQIDALARAVLETSTEDFQSACSWLRSIRAIDPADVSEGYRALKALKDFFERIERQPDSKQA